MSDTKQRSRNVIIPVGRKYSYPSGELISEGVLPATISGRQKTVSESHVRSRDGKYHEGGPFFTIDVRPSVPFRDVKIYNNAKTQFYSGPLFVPLSTGGVAVTTDAAMQDHRNSDTSDLDPYGATAISRVAPTNPTSQMATNLGEIYLDGIKRSLPGINTWKKRTKSVLDAADEYLAAQFGWLPLVDEVKNVSSNIKHAHEIRKHYDSNAGSNTKREYEFPTETTSYSVQYQEPAQTSGMSLGTAFKGLGTVGTITRTVETVTRRWFVGSFTYPKIQGNSNLDRMARAEAHADHLLGTRLTPTVMWELTPWSWAVDWFTNAGEVVNNFTNFAINGLVMRYGYMMEEKSTTYTCTMSGGTGHNTDPALRLPPSSMTVVSKVRRPANPYGFGLGWEDLSPSQLLITAALGITRLRK